MTLRGDSASMRDCKTWTTFFAEKFLRGKECGKNMMMKSWQLCHSDGALMSKNTQKKHISFFKKATYHAVWECKWKQRLQTCLSGFLWNFSNVTMNGKLRKKCTIIQRDIKDYNHGTLHHTTLYFWDFEIRPRVILPRREVINRFEKCDSRHTKCQDELEKGCLTFSRWPPALERDVSSYVWLFQVRESSSLKNFAFWPLNS